MNTSHLAVEISDNSIRMISMRGASVMHRLHGNLTGKTIDDRKESLHTLFDQHSFLKDEFDNITLAWCNDKSTLVPNLIFAESSPKEIFELCFGKDSIDREIDYNRISELSVVNVYQVPDWIKSFFVIKFPRVVVQHAGSHIVRNVLNENAFHLKATIVCFESYFRLTMVKHNNLAFYSSFTYQSAEDVIYHLNFALQQKELLNEKGTIELVASVGSDESVISAVADGLNRISELKKMEILQDHDYLAKSQLLCV